MFFLNFHWHGTDDIATTCIFQQEPFSFRFYNPTWKCISWLFSFPSLGAQRLVSFTCTVFPRAVRPKAGRWAAKCVFFHKMCILPQNVCASTKRVFSHSTVSFQHTQSEDFTSLNDIKMVVPDLQRTFTVDYYKTLIEIVESKKN